MVEVIQQLLADPVLLGIVVAWSLFWKGLALWRSARMNQLAWFSALLIINTVGIFEIIYLFVTRKRYKYLKGLR